MKDSERDISKALAAFGAPRLKYHSFANPPLAQPEAPLNPAISVVQQPLSAPPPVAPRVDVVPPALSAPAAYPPPSFPQELRQTPAFDHQPIQAMAPPSVAASAPMGYTPPPPIAPMIAAQAPIRVTPPAAIVPSLPRSNDTALSDVFNFLSMKPPSAG